MRPSVSGLSELSRFKSGLTMGLMRGLRLCQWVLDSGGGAALAPSRIICRSN